MNNPHKFKKLSLCLILFFVAVIVLSQVAHAQPLPAEQVFILKVKQLEKDQVTLSWDIHPGHYLYKSRIKAKLIEPTTQKLEATSWPKAIRKSDPYFGEQAIYEIPHLDITYPLPTTDSKQTVEIRYQGCSKEGFCYPPMKKYLLINRTLNTYALSEGKASIATTPVSEQSKTLSLLNGHSLPLIIIGFLGFGILLAFTPCVLPLFPIISGLILGNKSTHGSHLKAFALSSTYVVGMSLTYAAAGVAAALMGTQIQTALQKPGFLLAGGLLFVLLALSLFGLYDIRLPSSWQNRLNQWSNKQARGHYYGVFVMGILSALIVSPCVTPPLVGALSYIAQTGDILIGASALFALGIGMGIPLIALATVGSKLMPKAGTWMNTVKNFLGILLLGVAILLVERIIPEPVTLVLWAILITLSAWFLGAFSDTDGSIHQRIAKIIGVACFAYAVVLGVGASLGQGDPIHPLRNIRHQQRTIFTKLKTVQQLEEQIAFAKMHNKGVIVDFYADWCASCKRYEREVFADDVVAREMQDYVLLQADITELNEHDEALKHLLEVVAPPTIIFIGPDGEEQKAFRIVGEKSKTAFLKHLDEFKAAITPASTATGALPTFDLLKPKNIDLKPQEN